MNQLKCNNSEIILCDWYQEFIFILICNLTLIIVLSKLLYLVISRCRSQFFATIFQLQLLHDHQRLLQHLQYCNNKRLPSGESSSPQQTDQVCRMINSVSISVPKDGYLNFTVITNIFAWFPEVRYKRVWLHCNIFCTFMRPHKCASFWCGNSSLHICVASF